jgi:hypothetical protein
LVIWCRTTLRDVFRAKLRAACGRQAGTPVSIVLPLRLHWGTVLIEVEMDHCRLLKRLGL